MVRPGNPLPGLCRITLDGRCPTWPIVTCSHCGVTFTARQRSTRFCSRPCYMQWWLYKDKPKVVGTEAVCAGCGESYLRLATNQKYCSGRDGKRCRERSTSKTAAQFGDHLVCPGCGAEFVRQASTHKFCSRRCAARIETRKRLRIADPGLSGTCWWCHAGFSLLDGRRLYCSTECAKFVKSLWNLSRYGITRDDYREAWYRQDGKCAICRQPERTARNHLLSIDHDHVTGQFRGLLCSHCNRATGLFGDDPDVIDAAARYVRETRKADHG